MVIVSLAFGWIMLPFAGAILWAVVGAILFEPVVRRIDAEWPGHPNLSALAGLLAIILVVLIPAALLTSLLVQEASGIYAQFRSGQIDFGRYFQQVRDALPDWANGLLGRMGVTDFDAARAKLNAALSARVQLIASNAVTLGQGAFGFLVAMGVMLYLTFFLLRDGKALGRRVEEALPLAPTDRRKLATKFITVIRATVKGSLIVALVQGLIGGIVLSILGVNGAALWGAAMGFMSLLPAVGSGLIWLPIAIYLIATGALWQGIVLILCGVFIIGMVDNVLRPILVGRDVKMPDWLVLLSTLGGLEVFGFNGFIVGPVIAALFMAAWTIYTGSRENAPAEPLS